MNNDHAMAIVCDLALCIGREVTLDALLTKVLQRFMHHCATPVGAVLQQQREGYKLLKVIGDEHDMVFRAYRDPAGTAADTAPRRLERLDKRFEAVNRFIGKLIVIKEAELPVETTAGTATV